MGDGGELAVGAAEIDMGAVAAHRVVACGVGGKGGGAAGMARGAGAVHDQRLVQVSGFGHQAKICCTRRRPTARASISCSVVYTAKEARAVLGDTEAAHQRLGAMVAGADGNALAVQQRGDVVSVDAVHGEGDDAAPVLGGAENAQALDAGQDVQGVVGQSPFMRGNGVEADCLDVIDGGAEADGFDDRPACRPRKRAGGFAQVERA